MHWLWLVTATVLNMLQNTNCKLQIPPPALPRPAPAARYVWQTCHGETFNAKGYNTWGDTWQLKDTKRCLKTERGHVLKSMMSVGPCHCHTVPRDLVTFVTGDTALCITQVWSLMMRTVPAHTIFRAKVAKMRIPRALSSTSYTSYYSWKRTFVKFLHSQRRPLHDQ